jgi:hypothetical protein
MMNAEAASSLTRRRNEAVLPRTASLADEASGEAA